MRFTILLSLVLCVATPAAAVNWADRGNGVWIDRDSIRWAGNWVLFDETWQSAGPPPPGYSGAVATAFECAEWKVARVTNGVVDTNTAQEVPFEVADAYVRIVCN